MKDKELREQVKYLESRVNEANDRYWAVTRQLNNLMAYLGVEYQEVSHHFKVVPKQKQ